MNVGRAKGKAYLERLCDDLSDMLGLGDRNRMLVEAADAEFPTEQSVEASKAGSIKKAVDLSPRERIAALGTELTAFPTWCTRPVRWAR